MAAVRNHWITGLSLVSAVFMLATGTAMAVSGGEFDETGVRLFGGAAIVGGVSVLGGLWGLRQSSVQPRFAYGLVVAGMVVLGGVYWWFVFVPPLLALAVVWAGVVKKGLVRELSPV
jgi:hypothetical protein